jgi:hypothetical protein
MNSLFCQRLRSTLIIVLTLTAIGSFAQKKKSNQVTLQHVEVIDVPVIEWESFRSDTTVGMNVQTFSCRIRSKLAFDRIEVKVNGLTTDVYTANDFAPGEPGKYEKLIEPSITLRTGTNSIQVLAENSKGIKKESLRTVIVDPAKIAILRNQKDQTPPMIYLSTPSNIREDRVVVYEQMLKITGVVMDESGVQQLTVNNTLTPIKANGAFTIYLPLNVGENGITIEVKDVNQNIALKKFTVDRKNTDGTLYDPTGATNYLLIIGIDTYDKWPRLNNAVSDAEAVKQVLTSNYNFDVGHTTTLYNKDASRSNIYQALRNLIEKISPGDNLLIYYSGHGYFDKLLSEGYWVPVDGSRNDVSTYVENSQVLKIIENINSQHTFLVADACFSGSLFASSSRGYTEQVEKYKSRWGLASGRLENVSDGTAGTNSPFATSFIEFLKNNNAAKVPVSDLIQYVKKKVSEANSQTPIGNPLKGVGDEGGEFVFYKKK